MTVAAVAAVAAPARSAGRERRRPVRRTVQLRSTGVNAPTAARSYFYILVEFMEYKNNCSYPLDKGEFSFEELNSITPEDIYRWMADKSFGTPNPGPEDLPKYARCNSLAYYKKALSYFMPNRGTKWTVTGQEEGQGFGNPTKSDLINDLISSVRRKETRGIGKKSKADRPFTRGEFIQAVQLIQQLQGTRRMDNYRHQAMMKFQNHMIARSDCTAHVKKDGLKASTQFPEFLTAKLRWCKNVREERDCPDQIIIPSMNPHFCPVLGLAMFLETWCAGSGRNSQWLFAEGITSDQDFMELQDKEANRCKNAYATALAKVLRSPSFIRAAAKGALGTHSIRKISATTARAQGATKDEVDYRGRWKSKRMQDRYTDTQLYWPDIRAATKLCDRGACVYRVKEGIGITDEWLSMQICPNIHQSFSAEVATICAKALVWACFDAGVADTVPGEVRNRVITKVNALIGEEQSTDNPIEKLEVIASQEDGTISFDVIRPDDDGVELVDEEGNQVGAATAVGRMSTQWRAAIYAKVSSTATRVTNIEQVTLSKFSALERENKQLKDMLRTLLIAPARIIHPGTANRNRIDRPDISIRYDESGAAADPPATLHKNIQTLELLWDEWENGIGGNKPAKEYTDRERGRNKYAYCRRLGYWTCMERLMRRGCTVPTAINRIKRAYVGAEYNTMTKLLKAIKNDEKNGGHHLLR